MGCRLDVRCPACDGCLCPIPEKAEFDNGGYCGGAIRLDRRRAAGIVGVKE